MCIFRNLWEEVAFVLEKTCYFPKVFAGSYQSSIIAHGHHGVQIIAGVSEVVVGCSRYRL